MKAPFGLFGLARVVAVLAFLLTVHGASGQNGHSVSVPPEQKVSQRLRLTLQDALNHARRNSTQFQAVVTNLGLALEYRAQARSMLLPTATYNSSPIYTQSTGLKNQIIESARETYMKPWT
jgi:hypothetical protein